MISTAINSALQTYATTDYVNARVDEYAGSYQGTYASLAELQATTGNHHNDYAWVQTEDANGNTVNDRYKYNGSAWVFEYRLTNNNFTSAELDAIASGMTSTKTTKLDNLPPTASPSISATTGAAAISGSKQFFVGTQGQDGRWTLESLTPAEMQKCAYSYLANATVGNTPAHLQGTDASGNPQRITPTDLASLLGVLTDKTNTYTNNLNNITDDGIYSFNASSTNIPSFTTSGLVFHINIAKWTNIQIVITADVGTTQHIAYRYNKVETWVMF
jgi:hypothetical protein